MPDVFPCKQVRPEQLKKDKQDIAGLGDSRVSRERKERSYDPKDNLRRAFTPEEDG